MFGTMKAGHLEMPVTEVRLIGGVIELAGEVRATWRRPIRSSGGPVEINLYGSDGQQIGLDEPTSVEIPELGWGDTYRLTLTLSGNGHRDQAWVALRRMAAELPPPQRAIANR